MFFILGLFAAPVFFFVALFALICYSFFGADRDSLINSAVAYALIAIVFILSFGGNHEMVTGAAYKHVLFDFIGAYWGYLLAAFPLYFAIGAPWTIFKWRQFAKAKADEIKDKIADAGTAGAAAYFAGNISYGTVYDEILKTNFRSLAPQVRKNKARVLNWIGFWPSSVAWFLLHDPVVYVYNSLKSLLQRQGEKIFADAFEDKDMTPPAPPQIEESTKVILQDNRHHW